jgi:glyoxylase-like metal-dependent hydrolase (beta-lactamase superfamily II)
VSCSTSVTSVYRGQSCERIQLHEHGFFGKNTIEKRARAPNFSTIEQHIPAASIGMSFSRNSHHQASCPHPMNIHTIHTGNFKLDGGAMFGVVPQALWQKHVPADENNLCTWAMRSMLIEEGDRLLLVDTGIGNKQSEKFFSHYHLHGNTSLDGELHKRGFSREDITDVLLTHLHFDHVGGAVERNKEGHLRPAFPNAKYWTCEPFPSSFPGLEIFFADGHTESQMIPIVPSHGTKVAFMADLTPAAAHLPTAWVIGYDTRPLLTMDEKQLLLEQALHEDWVLFFEHDAVNACCRLQQTTKGIRARELAPSMESLIG